MSVTLVEWLVAFLFTQAVEMPIYRHGARVSWGFAAVPSTVTHPLVWLVFFGPWFDAPHEVRLLAAETFAVLAEAAIVSRRVRATRALGLALLANVASVLLGELSRSLTGMP